MSAASPMSEFDAFISYAYADDRDGWVGALVEAIQASTPSSGLHLSRFSSTAMRFARWTTGSTASSTSWGTRR